MKEIISEINRINEILGVNNKVNLTESQEDSNSEKFIERIVGLLRLSDTYSAQNQKNLNKVVEYSKDQIIDFRLLERGLIKVLKLKGDKNKNVLDFFKNLLKSLKKRQKQIFTTQPELDDEPSFELQEPSVLPKKIYKQELYYLQVELLKLQEWLSKTGKTVIIVFEGRDSAGKGSTIKKFTEYMNPRLYNVIALGVPTPDERKNWWDRYRSKIQKGKINMFDRSWYNRGLIEPVMGYGSPEEYEDFMNNVSGFESDLVKDGDYLFKLWFSIDKDTQAKRFEMRQQSPLKYWKYSPNDAQMQDLWDRFTEYKDKLFDATSTVNSPWVVMDSNDKKISGLNAIRYVLQNIPYDNKNEEVLNKSFPEAVTVLKPENQ
jgi:polyphosphate kinase 2